jgi:hypothetical protein
MSWVRRLTLLSLAAVRRSWRSGRWRLSQLALAGVPALTSSLGPAPSDSDLNHQNQDRI